MLYSVLSVMWMSCMSGTWCHGKTLNVRFWIATEVKWNIQHISGKRWAIRWSPCTRCCFNAWCEVKQESSWKGCWSFFPSTSSTILQIAFKPLLIPYKIGIVMLFSILMCYFCIVYLWWSNAGVTSVVPTGTRSPQGPCRSPAGLF